MTEISLTFVPTPPSVIMQRFTQAIFLTAFTILAFCCSAHAEDCTLKQLASLPIIERIPDTVAIEVLIGDTPRYFLVDTGGVYSEIYSDLVEELHLDTHAISPGIEVYDVGGNRAKRFTTVPKLTIGGLRAENYRMIVEPRENTESKKIDGILGPDILGRFDVEFDFATKKLNLFSPEHCKGKVVYWSQAYVEAEFAQAGGHIVLPMALDGQRVEAILDTGSSETYLNEKSSRRLFNLENNSPGMERVPDATADTFIQYRYRFKSLSLNGLAVSNPLIYIMPNTAEENFGKRHLDKMDFDPVYKPRFNSMELLLGMNVIQKLHLYVAYKEHKIYLTAADAH